MLSPNITSNLDYLASIGVLDYDAAADIAGSRPRYGGKPTGFESPFVYTPLDYTDFSYNRAASPNDITIFGRPFWNVALKAALWIGGILLGGNVLLKMCQGVKNFKFKNLFVSKKQVQNSVNNTVNNVKNNSWFKKAGNSISGAWNSCINSLKKLRK